MSKRMIFFGVLFVVLVSGCSGIDTSGSSFAMGNGLQINKLEFKPAKLVSGQATLLTLNVQNMGSRDTEKAYVHLYGLSNQWYEGSTLIGDISSSDPKTVDIGGLRAANEELKTAGEKKVVVWKLKSPVEELEGTEFTHKVFARVCYHYATDVLAKIEVVGEDEWLLLEQTGKYSEHPISVKQTAAPIQINIESMQPVIVAQELSFQIKVSNVGGGYAFFGGGKTCADAFDGSGDATDDVGLVMNNIKFVFSGTESACDVSGSDATNAVWLAKGQDRKFTVTCSGFTSDMPMKEINLQVQMTYDYYIDSEATAILVGVKGAGDTVPTTTALVLPKSISGGNCGFSVDGSLKNKVPVSGVCGSVNAQLIIKIPSTASEAFTVTNDGTKTVVKYGASEKILGPNVSFKLATHTCQDGAVTKTENYNLALSVVTTGGNCVVTADLVKG